MAGKTQLNKFCLVPFYRGWSLFNEVLLVYLVCTRVIYLCEDMFVKEPVGQRPVTSVRIYSDFKFSDLNCWPFLLNSDQYRSLNPSEGSLNCF